MLRLSARLGLMPEAFWRLSLKEWRMLTRGDEATPMSRADLKALAQRWPDDRAVRLDRESRRVRSDGEGGG
ncbi:MAG: phage tail assembly chaperone [Caulobacterales bacterium]|nr:phage tail assembly chaperone [Caulobacterales bacterium]